MGPWALLMIKRLGAISWALMIKSEGDGLGLLE